MQCGGCDVGCSVVECDVWWGGVWSSVVWLVLSSSMLFRPVRIPCCCVLSSATGHLCTAMCTDHLHFRRQGHGSPEWVGGQDTLSGSCGVKPL